jgi:membrane protein insertase Oxa1/YidC/SpoIIIJ
MNKNYIVKYIIGWMVLSYVINFFMGGNQAPQLQNSAIIRIVNNKIISQKPIQCDIDILNCPLYKTHFDSVQNDVIITFKPQNSVYTYYFSEKFGGIVKITYHDHNRNQEIITFDVIGNDQVADAFPALTTGMNGVVINNFKLISNDENKIVFISSYNDDTVTKEFSVNGQGLSCVTKIITNNSAGKVLSYVCAESHGNLDHNEPAGAFAYTPNEGIVKFFADNKDLVSQTVVLEPAIVGNQSDYTVTSFIADSRIDRSYYSLDDKKIIYYADCMLDQSKNEHSFSVGFYGGIKNYSILKSINKNLAEIMDYGIILKIGSLFLAFILWLTHFIKSFGLALIIFMILGKLVFIPFFGIFRGYAKKNKELQQKLEYLKVKYHDNEEMRRQEEVAAYQKYGFMPLFMSNIPQFTNFLIIMCLQSIMRKNILLYNMPIGLWLKNAAMPDAWYILPAVFLIMLYITINKMKQLSPMIKIALLFASIILVYIYSSWSSAMQVVILASLLISYIENTYLNK